MYERGTCYGCKRTFSFNPGLVPAIRVAGVPEPICQACIELANPERVKRGLDPIAVPPGAYDPGGLPVPGEIEDCTEADAGEGFVIVGVKPPNPTR